MRNFRIKNIILANVNRAKQSILKYSPNMPYTITDYKIYIGTDQNRKITNAVEDA